MKERTKVKKMPAKAMIAAAKNPQNNQPQAQNQNQPQNNEPNGTTDTQDTVLGQTEGTTQAPDQNSFDWHNEREIQDNGNGSGTQETQPPAGTADQPKIINEECCQNCLEGKTPKDCTAICEEPI